MPNKDPVTQHSEAGAHYLTCQEFPRRVEKSDSKHPELQLNFSSRVFHFCQLHPGEGVDLGKDLCDLL